MQWIPEEKGVIDKSAAKRIATLLGWQPKREWVSLTDDEVSEILDYGQYGRVPQYARNFVDAIEAKLREKNT